MFGYSRRIAVERVVTELREARGQLASLVTVIQNAATSGAAEPVRAPEEGSAGELAALRAEVERLRARLADQDARLADQGAQLADQRSVIAGAAGATRLDPVHHEELAGRYQLLATQEYTELARLRMRSGSVPSAARSRATARLVRELIGLMLGRGPVDEEELAAWLRATAPPGAASTTVDDPRQQLTEAERQAVRNACDQTRRLRAELARCQQPMVLVDEVPRGEPVVPGTVRPWRNCQATGAIDFVVAPSYVAGGEVFSPALVFTVEPPEPGAG
ncbi:hypothetical protein [Micromonospora endophytica]|uniref:Uncharacterized protein n=1 Tax=Micromonospora endophytica TaxID=515350 RepID=A0A2W2CIU4_9ACTN|nr:hypothetical protein [Micromonospora endophytica]PZF99325.1 hypothetical protein C1I93_06120 [Micromonospora endophytica]RIW43031.1 hypothetical protein D3H59_21670 [Micromonospora endophytica]BCJ61305.1 hypothetical protein Jiend_47270 [Micromonospora endophytica]